MESIKQQLNAAVSQAMAAISGLSDCNANVVTASKPEFGDYQANGVMAIAKQLRTNPREIAQKVVDHLEALALAPIDKLEVAGPGFINIHLSDSYLLSEANSALQKPDLFIGKSDSPQKIAVDYSSPNLAKEMHVGHLRGTIIGDCLVRVLEKMGHEVVRQNHVGDWGTQFGMLITHLRELEGDQNEQGTQLADLEVFYRDAKERFDNDADFATQSRLAVVKLQSGDPEYVAAWEQFIDESLKHCEAVYEKLAVTLSRDDLDAESRYNDDLPIIISDLESKELLTESDGARCVFLEQFKGKDDELLPLIVQKSDGGYLYSTTDLAAVRLRMRDQIHRSLYVVHARQSLHFQQVFAVAREAGFADDSLSLEHIAYGTIMGSDGRPFKTRSGDSVKLEDLLDEAVKRAHDLVSEKNPELTPEEKTRVAQSVGIGAVKYADLSKNRTSDYVFDWNTMLSFEGNTAPYMLYAYARIRSILRKATAVNTTMIAAVAETEERVLLVKNLQLPEVVAAIAKDCYPNQLCNYLYELAGVFMRFYEVCPILKAEDTSTVQSRLALAQLTAQTLQQGLDLLGIETLEKM
ncbi:MAG: arginine--tRNA ligase [Pseudomonadales bacterium]|nr:arginine--tRNA ligase [Pseudomonadales bacterium]